MRVLKTFLVLMIIYGAAAFQSPFAYARIAACRRLSSRHWSTVKEKPIVQDVEDENEMRTSAPTSLDQDPRLQGLAETMTKVC